MTRYRQIGLFPTVAAGIVAILIVYVVVQSPKSGGPPAPRADVGEISTDTPVPPSSPSVDEGDSQETDRPRGMTGNTIQAYLDGKESYLPAVSEYFEEALEGDADAQYLSWRMLDFCDDVARHYQHKSMEEVIQKLNLRSPWRIAGVETSYKRCIEIANIGLDSYSGWQEFFDMAVAQEQPMALADEAESLLRLDRDSELGRSYLETAAQSGDAEAMLRVGDKARQIMLTSESESLAWILAACELGADCGPDGFRVTELCQFSAECVAGDDYPGMIARHGEMDPQSYDMAIARSKAIVDLVQEGHATDLQIDWGLSP